MSHLLYTYKLTADNAKSAEDVDEEEVQDITNCSFFIMCEPWNNTRCRKYKIETLENAWNWKRHHITQLQQYWPFYKMLLCMREMFVL